jgi:DNA-binding beta-propeller fold protein YncE
MTHRFTTDFYSVPDLELVHRDTIDLGFTRRYSQRRNSIFTVDDYLLLYEYNLDSFQIVRRWHPHDKDGNPYWMTVFDMSADDNLLYLLGSSPRGTLYITYDLVGDSVIAEHGMYAYFGHVRANPVSGEVYVTDPGVVIPWFTPGTIYVFDGQTGEYLRGISLYGYLEDSWEALSGWYLDVSPDGSQLYVCTGHEGREPGTVLRIDTRTRRVEKILFPEFWRWPARLVVGPKP